MTLLVEAMGINSPSIYAAFGSKEDLFREAVNLYIASDGGSTWRALTEVADTRSAIEAMLKDTIRTFTNADLPRGCLIVLGARHLGGGPDPIGVFLRDQRERIRGQLRERLCQGIGAGDLPADTDVEALAGMFITFLNGVSIEAADGVAEDVLIKSADALLQRWPVP